MPSEFCLEIVTVSIIIMFIMRNLSFVAHIELDRLRNPENHSAICRDFPLYAINATLQCLMCPNVVVLCARCRFQLFCSPLAVLLIAVVLQQPGMTSKRTRAAGRLEHNGLRLHSNRVLPFAIECKVLEFISCSVGELLALFDASRDCRSLVEHFLSATASLTVGAVSNAKWAEVRAMNVALANCKRLQSLTVVETVGPSDRMFTAVWACDIIRANAASLQEFRVKSSNEVQSYCSLRTSIQFACRALPVSRGLLPCAAR